jgi:hypothetical protein
LGFLGGKHLTGCDGGNHVLDYSLRHNILERG